MHHRSGALQRRGFTILEIMIALGVFMLALVMTAQLGAWSMLDRAGTQMRLEAAEAAANVLEAARSVGWQKLDAQWAQKQKLADYGSARLEDAELTVKVNSETSGVKRVDVDIQWPRSGARALRPVHMTAYFGPRDTPLVGTKR